MGNHVQLASKAANLQPRSGFATQEVLWRSLDDPSLDVFQVAFLIEMDPVDIDHYLRRPTLASDETDLGPEFVSRESADAPFPDRHPMKFLGCGSLGLLADAIVSARLEPDIGNSPGVHADAAILDDDHPGLCVIDLGHRDGDVW